MPAVSPVMPVSASPHHDVAGQRHMRASFASASRLRWAVAASRTVARIPVTVGVLALVLSMGIYTGTLWHAADAVSDVLAPLSFGTPRLQDGRPWTFAIGAFVQSGPEWYVIAVTLCIGLAAYEKRIGSLRTAVALFGTQLAATLVTAALLWPRVNESWAWAASLAHQVDVGISAGVLGVLGASTAIISHPWRRGVRLCALAYLSVMVLRSGLLPDVEQLLAFGSGVLLGPILAGRPPLPIRSPRPGGLEARLVASALVASMAVGNLVDAIHPGIGGVFGAGLTTHPPMHGFALIIGELAVGLLVADALRRGRAAAWWVAAIGSGVLLINSLVNTRGPLHIGDAVCAAAVLLILIAFRESWHWRTPDGLTVRSLRRLVAAVGVFGIGWMVTICLLREFFEPVPGVVDAVQQVLAQFTVSAGPSLPHGGLFRALLGASAVAWALTLLILLGNWMYADRGPEAGPRDHLEQLLRCHGGGSLGWMRTWPAFSTWITRDGRSAISYCVIGTVAIAIGDPVGPVACRGDAIAEFRQFCRHAGWTACWFAATAGFVRSARDWHAVQIGEDTVLDLTTLEFVGKEWQDVRTARNRAGRDGMTMVTGRLAEFPVELRSQIERLSQAWVSGKPLPEMAFTLGTVDHALDPEMRTHVAIDAAGSVHGVTTWLPVHESGEIVGWTLDLMRRRSDGFRPVMEYLIAESALLFRNEGCATLSLSVAPLARRSPLTSRRISLDRTLDVLSGLLEPTYGFQSLLAFKAKFRPEFRPVYLVYSQPADLVAIGLAISRAYLPNVHPKQAAGLLWALRHNRSHPTRSADRPAITVGA